MPFVLSLQPPLMLLLLPLLLPVLLVHCCAIPTPADADMEDDEEDDDALGEEEQAVRGCSRCCCCALSVSACVLQRALLPDALTCSPAIHARRCWNVFCSNASSAAC